MEFMYIMEKSIRYRREIAELTRLLVSLGLSQSEIVRLLALPPARFDTWKKEHPELQQALAGPTPESRAEAALIKRALGFQLCEATSEELVDKKSGEILEVLKRRTTTKEVPPDVRALLFYLKNRWPEHWGESSDEYKLDLPPEEADL